MKTSEITKIIRVNSLLIIIVSILTICFDIPNNFFLLLLSLLQFVLLFIAVREEIIKRKK